MSQEAPHQTLQPTTLVHGAWLRLVGADGQKDFANRAHFFAAAAGIPMPAADDEQLLAVNEALEKFAVLDPRKAELVKLRYFVGMSFEEAAALDISEPTAKRWWAYARA